MQIPGAVVEAMFALAAQVDPNAGTAVAQKGAMQRLADPTYYDVVFPILAFLLVLALMIGASLWIARVLLFAFLVCLVISATSSWRKRSSV